MTSIIDIHKIDPVEDSYAEGYKNNIPYNIAKIVIVIVVFRVICIENALQNC
jgi:hypothetical protein